MCMSGEGGIRTPDTVTRMPHFECGAFNHSATSPWPQQAQIAIRRLCIERRRAKQGWPGPARDRLRAGIATARDRDCHHQHELVLC
jgi:hypothetical protein